MTLMYHWEDVTVNEIDFDADGRSVSPHSKAYVRDVDYTYYVTVQLKDIIDYLGGGSSEGMLKMFEFLDNAGAIDIDQLENDDDFVAFMTERYEQEAINDFEEGNEAY